MQLHEDLANLKEVNPHPYSKMRFPKVRINKYQLPLHEFILYFS